MKKTNTSIAMLLAVCMLSSCATVFGGKITEAQRTRPLPGQPSRAIRPVALIADLFFWPGIIIDFATGAIYRPEKAEVKKEPEAKKDLAEVKI
ncbi:hypothetical protein [Pedobacter nutrimenti]|uniref:hypothetical protein n=1 Tax=Pedobacter nutrimenti TaxID=1241337 RepID=UPI002930FDBE|nr:hypothetical protein [Pedobacter nutrimenti]